MLSSQMAPKSSWERELSVGRDTLKMPLVKKTVIEDLGVHGCSGAPRGN